MTKLRKRVRELEMEREHLKKSRNLVRSGNECRSEQIFGLVKAYQAQYPVWNLCQILGVSSSGFYAWLKRPPSRRRLSDIMIGDRLEAFHRESDGNYGRPRLHADLREHGIAISGKRVARLMRERNIQGATRRRFTVTTVRDRTARPAPDLVDRRFQADAPDQLWVADITYVPTWSGFLYLAVVLDVYSRRIVGWAMANHLRTELVLDALDMAISGGIQRMSSITPTRARSTRRSRLDRDAARPEFDRRWDRSAIATTTRCARARTQRSNASCSSSDDSRISARHRSRSSTSSKVGTTRVVATQPSAISHPTTSSGG